MEADNGMAEEKVVGFRARKERIKDVLSKRKAQLEGLPGGAEDRESHGLPMFEELVPVPEAEFLQMAAVFEQRLKQYNLLTGEVPVLLGLAQQAMNKRKLPVAAGYFNLIKEYIRKTLHVQDRPGFDAKRDLDLFVPQLEKAKQD
jgi:hypothetical protein